MNVRGVVKLKEGERVLRVVRQFWVVYLSGMIVAFILIAAPFFFMVPLLSLGKSGIFAFALSSIVGVLYGFRLFYVWYWHSFIITSKRVIDVDQHGLFSRVVSEATYEKIQDVSYGIKGVVGTLLKMGSLVIQTAGSTTNLELTGIRDPKDVHHLVTETMQAFQTYARGGARSEKVAHLLEAASDLSDVEARAFLVAIQEAVAEPRSLGWKQKDVEGLMRDIEPTEDSDG